MQDYHKGCKLNCTKYVKASIYTTKFGQLLQYLAKIAWGPSKKNRLNLIIDVLRVSQNTRNNDYSAMKKIKRSL